MEKLGSSLISIFEEDHSAPEVLQSMRDLVSLSGVLSELGPANAFAVPSEVLRFLRIIQLINEEALGLGDPIENSDTLYYRYRSRFIDNEPPSKKRVAQIVNVLSKYNWISKQSKQLKMRSLGKRMMDALLRLANDGLAYYMHDEIGRSLFQAKRDAELSEAYDDRGISGGNKIASLIRNVENAITLLKERELELLADRNALPQLQMIHELMKELEEKLQERLQKFQTLEDSLVLTTLMQKGTAVLAEGTNLSLGMINKYLKFTSMQQTPLSSTIRPELVRSFIMSMYDPPLDSDVPNVYQLFSFMEQNQYEEEGLDGLWIPVKFASPLSAEGIQAGVDFIEMYEPVTDPIKDEEEEVVYTSEEILQEEMKDLLGESKWLMMKSMIQTDMIEDYLQTVGEASMEQVVIEATSDRWSDAVNSITAIAALVSNKQIEIEETKENSHKEQFYNKEWEWMNNADGRATIRTKHKRKSSTTTRE